MVASNGVQCYSIKGRSLAKLYSYGSQLDIYSLHVNEWLYLELPTATVVCHAKRSCKLEVKCQCRSHEVVIMAWVIISAVSMHELMVPVCLYI